MSIAAGTIAPPRRRRRPVPRTVRHLLRAQLALAGWFWGVAVAMLAVAAALVDRLGTVETSIVQYAQQASMWFPFSLAVLTVATALTPHVAAGMTRRSFARAAVVVAVVQGLGYTLANGVLLAAEGVLYRAQGWPQTVQETLVVSWDGDGPQIAVQYLFLLVLAPLSGLLVGIVYYRAGGWWGTVALPLTAGPLLLVMVMFSVAVDPLDVGGLVGGSLPGSALLAALAVVAVALAFVRVARGATLKAPTS